MATFTASAAQAGVPAVYRVGGTVTRVVEYVHQATSLSIGDVIQMCKIPNGAMVTDVRLAASMSAGVNVVNIGDGNDTSAYGASVVLSGAGVVAALYNVPIRGLGRSYSAEDTIDIQVIAGASVGPSSAQLRLVVSYTNQSGQ